MSYWSAKRIVLNEHTGTYLSIKFTTPITQTPLPMQVPPLSYDKQSAVMNCQVLKKRFLSSYDGQGVTTAIWANYIISLLSTETQYTLHEDLKIPYVREVVFDKYAKHHQKREMHPNPLLHLLLDIGQPRRLKRTRPMDLLWGSRGSVDGRGLIMSLGGLQYTPSVSILAYRICKILIANLIKYIQKNKKKVFIPLTHWYFKWN